MPNVARRRLGNVGQLCLVLMALVVGGCAPVTLQPLAAESSAPRWFETEFVMRDGAGLPYQAWLPPPGQMPQAVIVAVHGFNDYRRAFELPGPYLASAGMAVYAYDQRGFGAAPSQGYWPGQALLIADLEDVVALVAARHPNLPLYLLGDSMGAGVVIVASLQPQVRARLTGVILNAPAVWGGSTFNPAYRVGLWTMAHVAPGWQLTGGGLRIRVSDNIALLRSLARDPLMLRGARTDVLYGLVHLMDDAARQVQAIPIKSLVLYGLRDEVIPKTAICDFLARAPSRLVEHRFYPNGYHLLLRDLQARVVWDDIRGWIAGEVAESADDRGGCRQSGAV